MLSIDAVNIWTYHYNIVSRQLLAENKLLLTIHKQYRPYVLVGLGEGFNYSHGFRVTPQNSGEVATAFLKIIGINPLCTPLVLVWMLLYLNK